MCSGRRHSTRLRAAVGRARTESSRHARCSPCTGYGHHSDAARRRRAHPMVDARAGERARGGAARRSRSRSRSTFRVERRRRRRKWLGFSEETASSRVLFNRNHRAAVRSSPMAEIRPRRAGLLSAQAGGRNGGPGPGWPRAERAPTRRGHEREARRSCGSRAGHVRGPRVTKKERARAVLNGPTHIFFPEANLIEFKGILIIYSFSEANFSRIAENLIEFKFKFDRI
jgi:hypothetical protein